MRIGLLAPVALSIPPEGYGGTELVVAMLADGLVARGHRVVLFASGDSRTTAELRALHPRALTPLGYDTKEKYLPLEARHAEWSLAQASDLDLIHDHTKTQGVLRAASVSVPVVTTIHNDFTPERRTTYLAHAKHRYVSISKAQASRLDALNYVGTVYNGIDLSAQRPRARKEDFLLFLGRLCEAKGTHTAIALAQRLDLPLVLAGKVDPVDREYFEAQVAPHLSDPKIRFVGEVHGAAKWDLLSRARCLVFPIQWAEPFGLVMIEAMACGTPVVATRYGSVPEVVEPMVSGWIADDFEGLVEGVSRAAHIPATSCRGWVEARFSAEAMVEGYLSVYERILRGAS
ncbi:glycosyltransferase family 4 protein [bacterium]|nr:glycosyltransferase family 4 protein [bacterium]